MKKFILYLSTMLLIFVGIIYSPKLIKADSGFDSSWDSGSSDWGRSSDWDSSSWDSSDSDGDLSGSGMLAVIVITVIVIIVISIICSKKEVKLTEIDSYSKLSDDEIHEYISDLDIEKFNNKVFDNYKKIQEAWSNFDIDTIRNLVSDEIYNMYSMQLDTLKVKSQKNIMSDITYVNNYITNIIVDNDTETIETILKVSCFDYLVDDKNNVVRGNKNIKLHYTYKLTFTRKIDKTNLKYCPNCGAELSINSSGVCDYCKSTIINNETDWIMTKKEMLKQN